MSMICMLQKGPHKGLIGILYAALNTQGAVACTSQSRLAWQADVSDISDEDWEEAIEAPKQASPALRECPPVQDLWLQATKCIHDLTGTLVPLDPKLCLLGILDDDTYDKFQTFQISRIFNS